VGCWYAATKLAPQRAVFYIYAIAACYLMLFNSRTEVSTYAMVGPVYGILLADAWVSRRSVAATAGYLAAVTANAFSTDLAELVTARPNHIWLSPLVCTLVTIAVAWHLTREIRERGPERNPGQTAVG
jgi:hypothetical protein